MLILAGVSINAIVGENGILTRTQYATFLNEMAAVEEAVQMWKAGDAMDNEGETTAIPTNGMCQINTLDETERLKGEIGYYRAWSINEIMPTTNILSSADDFNNDFGVELISYPSGIQDLYFLNNEACNIDSKKIYLIDAATGMVYSVTGITLKGVSCYSSSMAKAVMNGINTAPQFTVAEVSGSGTGEKLAGNNEPEFLPDGTKNPNYNPNGFQIIASKDSNNIFKLYNNGDLYGKGVKGIQLNTSQDEMEKINTNVWREFEVPDIIPGASSNNIQIFPGNTTIYVIDSDGYLWAWGSNASNKLGLTEEQKIEYTGMEPIKLDIDGKKVKEVYSGYGHVTFVITEANDVYAAGNNTNGCLGLGYKSTELEKFTKVEVPNVENIYRIMPHSNGITYIWYNDNIFYAAGTNNNGILGTGNSDEYLEKFTRVYDGNIGPDIDSEVKDMVRDNHSVMILKNDGTIWQVGYKGYNGGNLTGDNCIFNQFPTSTFGSNVTAIYALNTGRLVSRTNNEGKVEVWGCPSGNNVGLTTSDTLNSTKYWKIELPEELENSGIKEIFSTTSNAYYLSNNGKVYVSGEATGSGLNLESGKVTGIVYTGLENIKTMYTTNNVKINGETNFYCSPICFSGEDGKIYTVGSQLIVLGDKILQKDWTKVASNVLYFDGAATAYIDKNNDLYIAGSNPAVLGIDGNSEPIKNYILHPDISIRGKVKEIKMKTNVTYILTTDGELLATGYYAYNGTKQYPGWEVQKDQTTFVKILDNIIAFDVYTGQYGAGIAISKDGIGYAWGANYGGVNGQTVRSYNTPIEYDLKSHVLDCETVKKLTLIGYRSCLLTESNCLYKSGNWSYGFDGGKVATDYFSEYTYNINLQENENIVDFVGDAYNMLILTNKGRLFGYGDAKSLGIGDSTVTRMDTREITGISNVVQIIKGNGWHVAIKNDGTVWGTGTNIYGILGRWVGSPRGSRYRTSYEWVECPDLEI